MPVTFFAHQAPVLSLGRQTNLHVDGIALVVGSMAPDFAYVLNGSRFSIWAHGFPWLVLFCVPATLVASWITVRVLAPVVPDHLPNLGAFHLHDYRGLSTHRFGLIASPLSAFAGALSHVGLDHFTHEWGWFANNVDWYDDQVIDGTWLGRHWTVFRVIQYIGHIGGTALCLMLLWVYGRDRWMQQRATTVPLTAPTRASYATVWLPTLTGAVIGAAWVVSDRAGSATDTLRVAATTFAGMTTGACALRLLPRVLVSEPHS